MSSLLSDGLRRDYTGEGDQRQEKWQIKGSAARGAWKCSPNAFRRIIAHGRPGEPCPLKKVLIGDDEYELSIDGQPIKQRVPFTAFDEDGKETNLFNEEMRYAHRQARQNRHKIESAEYQALCTSLWYDLGEILSAPEFPVEKLSTEDKAAIDEYRVRSEETAFPFPCDAGTTWEQVSFTLKTDDLVYVNTPKGKARLQCNQLGFADKRKGYAPNVTTWPLFQVLAKMDGEINLQGNQYLRNLPDNARRLNKHLKKLFSIKESIWVDCYKKTKSYKSRFTIRDERDT